MDEANQICNLLSGHNHDPVEEPDYCGNEVVFVDNETIN